MTSCFMLNVVYTECRVFMLLCWLPLCWVPLYWLSLCWVSWRLVPNLMFAQKCNLAEIKFYKIAQSWQCLHFLCYKGKIVFFNFNSLKNLGNLSMVMSDLFLSYLSHFCFTQWVWLQALLTNVRIGSKWLQHQWKLCLKVYRARWRSTPII